MSQVTYREWNTLQNRGPVDPAPDESVEGILLVGTKPALEYYGNQSHYGEDSISIFPAVHNGKRCWVQREVWCPSENYSASGTQEFIIDFEKGVKIFLEKGVFEFPFFADGYKQDGALLIVEDDPSPVGTTEEQYEGRGVPHVPSARVLAAREAREPRGPRPPRS